MSDLTALPDEDLPSSAFFIESHIADAMPHAHWHDHIEINYLPAGKMDYLFNGQRTTLLPRRLGVFWAAMHHQVIDVQPDQELLCAYIPVVQFYSLPLDSEFKSALLKGDLVQTAIECPWAASRLETMSEGWLQSGSALRQVYREELLLRLRRMSFEPTIVKNAGTEELTPQSTRRASPRLVAHAEKMTAYINANIGQSIRVSDVADAVGLHQTSALSAFRKVLGLSIGQYIRRRRLSAAMHLLADSDREIADVAHAAGYRSLTRLYDAFHSQVGKTPRKFRQEIRGVKK